jgi:DNA-binding XRE family transcriptional regulator
MRALPLVLKALAACWIVVSAWRLDAAKLERLGRLVCGPLWQSELARTMGVSRQTVLRWAAGEFDPSPEHTAKAKKLVRARIGELQRLLKVL